MDNGQLKMDNDQAMQAVPKGYKQCEVGVIPEDWGFTTVGAEFSIQLGKMLDAEKNVGIPKPFLGNRSIQWGRIDVSEIGAIRLTPYDLQRFRLRDGDLLVCEGGEVGRAALWQGQMPECYYQKALHRLRPKRDYNVTLMLNVLKHLAATGALLNFVTQTSIAHLPKDKFETVPIPLPPTRSEQEAIAEALSDADALIGSLEQLLAKKRQIKQGAMQDLLAGKQRLLGFSGEWEIKQLGDVVEKFVGGGTPSRSNTGYWGGEIPWVTVKDFATFTPLQSQESITRAGLHGSASHLIPKGTLITSTRMALGKAVIYAVDVAINQDLKALFLKQCLSVLFLYFWFEHHGESIDELGSGSTVKGISLSDLRKIEFHQPPLPEQTAIVTILSDMDAEIAQLESRLTKARQIKQGMMQELLTGRIRLVRPSASVVSLSVSGGSTGSPRTESDVAARRIHEKSAASTSHNRQIEEAAILGVLSALCGTEQYPLARVRRTKLMYLFQRHLGQQTDVYLKKAAGPYNPGTRYKGPEGIAVKNGYVQVHHNGAYEGFVAGAKVSQAQAYLEKWHGAQALLWLEQVRFKKTDELELLATVDMAMQDLLAAAKSVSMPAVKQVIQDHPEWEAKLERQIFSDEKLQRAIQECCELFA